MGSKRNKLRQLVSPPRSVPPPPLDDDDVDLMDELMAQLDSRNPATQAESATVLKEMQLDKKADIINSEPKQDAKSRFKARQARKAAALAAAHSPDNAEYDLRLQNEAKEEAHDIAKVCNDLDVRVHQIEPDGHCLFSAIADQLSQLNIIPASQANYMTTRTAASHYIFSRPDEFLPFLPSVEGEDGAGATSSGMMTPKEFEQYCAAIRDTAVWGGEPEILALSRAYNVPIHVVQTGTPPVVIHSPEGQQSNLKDERVVRISYHRRMYGLGEHYNSLRPDKHNISSTVSSFFKA